MAKRETLSILAPRLFQTREAVREFVLNGTHEEMAAMATEAQGPGEPVAEELRWAAANGACFVARDLAALARLAAVPDDQPFVPPRAAHHDPVGQQPTTPTARMVILGAMLAVWCKQGWSRVMRVETEVVRQLEAIHEQVEGPRRERRRRKARAAEATA